MKDVYTVIKHIANKITQMIYSQDKYYKINKMAKENKLVMKHI